MLQVSWIPAFAGMTACRSAVVRVRAALVEDVVADLGRPLQRIGPIGRNRNGVEAGGAAGGVGQADFAGQDAGGQTFGFAPGAMVLPAQQIAIAGEGELAAGMTGTLIDH